jgi:ubiquitin-protein ligase
MKEATDAAKRKFNDYLLIFNQADLFLWEAFIEGPSGTPYEGRIFHVRIVLTS